MLLRFAGACILIVQNPKLKPWSQLKQRQSSHGQPSIQDNQLEPARLLQIPNQHVNDVCPYVYLSMYVYVYVYVHVYVYVCMHAHVHVSMHISIYC